MTETDFNGCLGCGEQTTDYILSEGLVDGLPTLYEQDRIRYEYNQRKQTWSRKSCTIFNAVGAVSDLKNYKFSLEEIKEIDELSYTKGRVKDSGWYTQKAVDLVCKWWNEHHADLGKIAYYRVEIDNDDLMHKVLEKNYDVCSGFNGNAGYTLDHQDGVLNLTELDGPSTYGHSVSFIEEDNKRKIKDNYAGIEHNIYEVEHKWSEVKPFHIWGYVFTNVAEDNLEEIKRLNSIKSECNTIIEELGKLWHMVNDTNFQGILHYTAEKLRKKIEDADNELKKY